MKRNDIHKIMVQRILSLMLFVFVCNGIRGQGYQTTYGNRDITDVSIAHKQPKWCALHQGKDFSDDFNENGWVILEDGSRIQATNLYVDTIYMHKGTSITLEIPFRKNGNTSAANYLRWFDYRTDGNYYCGTISGINFTDLLTMTEFSTNGGSNGASDRKYVYRFKNGYVGGWGLTNSNAPYGASFYYPSDEEFRAITNTNSSFNNGENNYYIVGCEVSMYNDFASSYTPAGGGSTFGSANSWYEPTLSGRALFYVIGVEDETPPEGFEHYWSLTTQDYQGGGNEKDADGNYIKKYLEEYEITFPSRRISINTNELVTLSKDPVSYAIPYLQSSSSDNTTLNVTFAEGEDNGLTLASWSQTGTNRIIQFYKGTSKAQWQVDDKSTATILVTKTVNGITFNIARYKLTFKEEVTPLTQTQVAHLKDLQGNENYWWKNLTHRSPEYMKANYEPITSLTFSYDTNNNASAVLNGGMSYAYPFPLEWNYCGYAFYDGSPATDVNSTSYGSGSSLSRTQWGMYSIVNSYIGYGDVTDYSNNVPPTGTGKDDGGYWLYMDASDRPGSLAELTFDERLCQGSELFCTAWIKSASKYTTGTSDDDGAVLLTVMGVRVDDDGNEIHEPIYRQCSGQIMVTTSLGNSMGETGLSSEVTGKGENTNQWFQLYFSFINNGNLDYDHYTLKIDNYCASTGGGDYYFDEVKIYVLHPTVEVVQLEPICTEQDDKSLMRIDVEYEAMMSRLGFDPSEYIGDENNLAIASIDFVIIDKAKYYNAIADIKEPSKEQKEEAFKAAIVTFYDSQEKEHQLPTLDFYLNYERNLKYNDSEPGSNQVVFGNNKDDDDEGDFFYRETENNMIELSVDCFTDMMAYTTYLIILEPHTDTDKTDATKLDEFIDLLNDDCAIKTEFYLTSTTLLKVNGEMVDPTVNYCAGQEFVISPQMTYTVIDENGEKETIYLDGVYFDWFFGSREEFIEENETYGVSLEHALIEFRNKYPSAEDLDGINIPDENQIEGFTKGCYEIIEYYLNMERIGGYNNMLVLYKTHLDMRMLSTGLQLVIQPIEVYLVAEDGTELIICFGYVPLTLMSSGDAPILKVGFSDINYHNNDYEPCLRLGLAQIEKCSETSPFTINLYGATYVTEESVEVDHLGVAEGMDMLFLVDTDDPTYREKIIKKEDGEEIVVGKIARLYATSDESNDPRGDVPNDITGSYMQIYFFGENDRESGWTLTPFVPREGYYYVLSIYFQEKEPFDEGDQAVGTACWGMFPLEIKVVPEYLKWTGDRYSNWNNDNHWKRADKSELNKPEADIYITNAENGTDNGFVPMLFSKVILPRDSEAELYMAGFILDETKDSLEWVGDSDEALANHDDVSEHPTGNIMYDVMLYESPNTGKFKTQHYRVNLCDEIHFELGAKLLHSEQLIYNKAWTEVEIPGGKWVLTATPLKAVVSGDWYTKTASGKETSEYFKDITFNLSENDRYEPEVYQRSWSTAGSIYTGTNGTTIDDRTTPSYVFTGWSSTYNDTYVPYQAGEGFSIKTYWGTGNQNVCFRFPKADTSYDYIGSSLLERLGEGTLLISSLVDRTDPDKDDDSVYSGKVTVDLTQTGNAYYIIGNPFTAHMSMKEFLAENTQFKGYWLESTYGPIAGTKDGTSWGDEDCLIEPYSAFFVTMDESDLTRADASPTVTFTKAMQKFEDEVEKTNLIAFSVRANSEVGTTGASLSYSKDAIDGYNTIEDAVLMEDATWGKDGMPLVYTVADDMAVSVNKVNSLTLVPLGCFADDDLEYTLTFVGVGNLNEPSLYDAYTNTDTPLTEGYTLEMTGATHGRYFIRSKGPSVTGIEEIEEDIVYNMSAYSPTTRTIVVSSEAGIETLEVYSLSGILLGKASVGGNMTCTLDGIESGVAIVRARTLAGTFVKKIRVK